MPLVPLPLVLLPLVLLAGCAASAPPQIACDSAGVTVTGEGIRRVEVWSDGLRVARRAVAGLAEARVVVDVVGGVEVRVRTGEEHVLTCVVEESGDAAVDVRFAAPAGQGMRPLAGGEQTFVAFEGAPAEVAVVVTARRPGVAEVRLGERTQRLTLGVAGQREVVRGPLPADGPMTVSVRADGFAESVVLRPVAVAADAVASTLAVTRVVFPSDEGGGADPARPEGRVTLPGAGWTRLLRWLDLGARGEGEEVPWSFFAVTLANASGHDLDVEVRSRVLGDEGPAAAFRPVVRDADGGTGIVSALVRVPAGSEATARLPLFVHDDALPEGASEFDHVLTVTPLGLSTPVVERREALHVSRGSSWVALGFALALIAACLGVGSALVGLPRWLRTWSTGDLTTIAVFATLGFVVTAATALLSSGVAALLGPFSMLVTGLVSDCLRSALLATLVVLLPRRGTATVFLLIGWLMQGVALGAFSPTDFVFVGSRIFWLEGFLWLAGLTRGTAWRDGSALGRFLRLSCGFAGASLLSMAGSIASQIVLFRLYYAAWFVALMLALPGFTYDVLACLLATSFAASLRKVQA